MDNLLKSFQDSFKINVGTDSLPTFLSNPITKEGKKIDTSIEGILKPFSESIGQPSLRAYGALGSFLSQKLGLSKTPLTPETQFQKDLYGTDQPITFRSVAEEIPFLKDSKFAPTVGFFMGALDLIPGGKVSKTVITKIAKSQNIKEILKELRGIGIAEEKATELAPRLVQVTDETKVADILINEAKITVTPLKERGFITTAKEAPVTPKIVAKNLESFYEPLTNVETVSKARKLIDTDINEAIRAASYGKTALANTVAQQLVVDYQVSNRFEEAINLVEKIAKRSTTQGQAIQVLSLFSKFTPEGVLRFAQRELDLANEARPNLNLKLTPKNAESLVSQAKIVQASEVGRKKIVETAKLMQQIHELIPSTALQKISTIQTMAQLLNPKTFIRNLVGNLGFAGIENVTDVISSPLDSALSLITGRRSTTLPSVSKQITGAKRGFSEGVEDAMNRIDTYFVPTQFDLPKGGVFKGGVGASLEKLLSLELRAPDRAFYQAAYDGSLYQQMKAKGVIQPTDDMIEIAHHDALYRTFQDDNVVSRIFVGLKKGLNAKKDFGLGDIVLKYPKTPGNLLARGIDYSPIGFLNALFHATRPLVGHPFNQRSFVQAVSRAIVGTTGGIGLGALLHNLDLITSRQDKDTDIRALERSVGLGKYKFNASAMVRFVMSGFNPEFAKIKSGDRLVSYDWFLPQSIALSIGANLDEGLTKENFVSISETVLTSLSEGLDTLAEQPLISGLQRVMRTQDFTSSVKEVLKGIPASFVPTFFSQINQLIDNTQRNVYSPDTVSYALNIAKNKIPGLAQTLPPSVGAFGEDLERYQGESNNIFNVFFNPAFISKFNPTPEAQMVLDLLGETGEKTQFPRVLKNTQIVNGESKKLSPTQITALQRYAGTATKYYFSSLVNDKNFQDISPEEKVEYIQKILTDIGTASRVMILGHRPSKMNNRVKTIIQQFR